MIPVTDVARVRLDNAMRLFDEFVQATIKSPDAATLRGLERRFAERLQIQPSYWSQIKGRSRQIGERLARQFEQLCRKPVGWMDLPQGQPADAARGGPAVTATRPPGAALAGPDTNAGEGEGAGAGGPASTGPRAAPGASAAGAAALPSSQPQDDDERFIVGLVLTYYRRHPARARSRLLGLLGEVLTPQPDTAPPRDAPAGPPPAPAARKLAPGVTRRPVTPAAAPAPDDDLALWARTRAAIAPLKGGSKRKP